MNARSALLGLALTLSGCMTLALAEDPPATTDPATKPAAETPAKNAADTPSPTPTTNPARPATGTAPAATTPAAAATPASSAAATSGQKYPPYADVTKDFETIDGMLKLRRKGNRLLAELPSGQLNRDFIVLISIAKGIGRGQLIGGMSWNLGDEWVWQFRKADERIHIVRKNVRFTASKNDPQERAVSVAFTDSVLFSLPILTTSPSGAYVVELTSVFMGDLPQIAPMLPGFAFSEAKSTWADIKSFKENVELEVAATYASNGMLDIDSVADSRGASINIHYSISQLPQTGYRPRMADDRVGYFLSVVKDWSHKGDDDRFVRYINRWDLQKADPQADLSPPKRPIIFWLEKTIPYAYRKPIREGINEWNKAFEKAGFVNAIEVRQQPDNADWSPEDVNYNTFRWITASASFAAMGALRVNPYTGQILDADVIFDADFLQTWKQEYETFTEESVAALTGGALDLKGYQEHYDKGAHLEGIRCEMQHGMARELAFGSTVLAARTTNPADREKLIMQGLKEATMHEIGHTLGLRHNFKASSAFSLDEINDLAKTRDTGLASSVMDYVPANIVPKSMNQGDYFSTTIGPYDMWAIEYGYKSLSGGTDGEVTELKKIAARSGDPLLAYATDEDTRGIDPDPLSNRYDSGKDTLAFARVRAQLINELWPKVIDEAVKSGDGYQKVRQVFGVLLGNHGQAMFMAARYVGGIHTTRSHKGDANASAPFVVVEAAKQREALALLEEQVFNDKPFQFPPDLYSHLAATRWNHWGSDPPLRQDYPVHDVVAMWQNRILQQLLSPTTLGRLHDSEMHLPPEKDALTTPELFSRLTKAIFTEVDQTPNGEFTDRKPYISSLRRNLQRGYLKHLSRIAMGNSDSPQDSQTVAFAELVALEKRINSLVARGDKLDTYSRAHLEESASRIHKAVDARLTLTRP